MVWAVGWEAEWVEVCLGTIEGIPDTGFQATAVAMMAATTEDTAEGIRAEVVAVAATNPRSS